MTPIYHDRFAKLTEELREALADGDEVAAELLTVLDKVYLCGRPLLEIVPSSEINAN